MSEVAMRRDVCAVIVTYHPPMDCAGRVEALRAEGTPVLVIDNGSREQELAAIGALASAPGVELIRNGANLGIAAALNRGVTRAIERGFRWALLLDQDSQLPAGSLDSLLSLAARFPHPERLAVVGARFEDPMQRVSAPLRASPPESGWDEVDAVITSGSLLSLAAYQRIGGFRDEFFIDYVDIDYCDRARRLGFSILRSKDVLIDHAVGEPRRGRFLWVTKWTTNHSAERRYYIARNDTVMLRESGRFPNGRWLWKSASRRLQMCKRILMFEESKLRKVAATAQGWWDGVRGRMGPRRR